MLARLAVGLGEETAVVLGDHGARVVGSGSVAVLDSRLQDLARKLERTLGCPDTVSVGDYHLTSAADSMKSSRRPSRSSSAAR